MSSTYQSRLSHTRSFSFSSGSTPKPRAVLKAPGRPLALRREYVTETKTTFIVRPQGNAASAESYVITDDDDTVLFTVTGWKFSDRSCREFRDASGLPLFELHRSWFAFARTRAGRGAWAVTLPGVATDRGFSGLGRKKSRSSSGPSSGSGSGSGDTITTTTTTTTTTTVAGSSTTTTTTTGGSRGAGSDNSSSGPGSGSGSYLATGTPRIRTFSSRPFGNFTINLDCNAAAVQSKSNDEKKLTLEIERHGNALALFDVVDEDRKVAEVRESIRHNKILPLISSQSGYRPVLDVVVTAGVDLSLVSTTMLEVSRGHKLTDSDCHDCRDCVGFCLQFECLAMMITMMYSTFNDNDYA